MKFTYKEVILNNLGLGLANSIMVFAGALTIASAVITMQKATKLDLNITSITSSVFEETIALGMLTGCTILVPLVMGRLLSTIKLPSTTAVLCTTLVIGMLGVMHIARDAQLAC